MEDEDEDNLTETGLPDEVARELDVIQYFDDDDNDYTFSHSADENFIPLNSKGKKVIKRKNNRQMLKTAYSCQTNILNKTGQNGTKTLPGNYDVAHFTMWFPFELISLDLARLLIDEAYYYANQDKNKPDFVIFFDKMIKFIELLFLSGCNIRKYDRVYWSVDHEL